MAGRQTVPAVLETQKATHGHLAAVYEKIQSAASKCVPRPRAWRRRNVSALQMRSGVGHAAPACARACALAPPDRACPAMQQALAPGHPGG